jgi:hypothetical protein
MSSAVGASLYVYGVVAADSAGSVALPEVGVRGQPVEAVISGALAALVSQVGEGRVRATRADLRAHQQVVEDVGAQATVLPMQFGIMVASPDEVARDILDAAACELQRLLAHFDGKNEYRLRATYEEEVALRQAVAANPAIARLQRRQGGGGGYHDRIQLGEAVAAGLAEIKKRDTALLVERLAPAADASLTVPSPGPDDNINLAFLVTVAQREDFERALEQVASAMAGRLTLELTGPLAPWDFVTTDAPLMAGSGAR